MSLEFYSGSVVHSDGTLLVGSGDERIFVFGMEEVSPGNTGKMDSYKDGLVKTMTFPQVVIDDVFVTVVPWILIESCRYKIY